MGGLKPQARTAGGPLTSGLQPPCRNTAAVVDRANPSTEPASFAPSGSDRSKHTPPQQVPPRKGLRRRE